MLDEQEAFLRAIFETPDDNVPRLVYADWLDEHGFPDHATLIRIQCELATRPAGEQPTAEQYALQAQAYRAVRDHDAPDDNAGFPNRGFRYCDTIPLTTEELADTQKLREYAASKRPEWFNAQNLKLTAGRIFSVEPIEAIYNLAALERVRNFDFSGSTRVVPQPIEAEQSMMDVLLALEFDYVPSITLPGLEALVQHRLARRMTVLNLTNNDLDNDALHVLMRSPQLNRLKELHIYQGNRFRGRTWARVQEHFGEEIVY